MKLIHTSDLHLGKSVCEYSMLEDQKHILSQILEIVDAERPDALLIAGDVYDKPIPPAEAVSLFDDFLVALSRRRLHVSVISGNHDSAERLAFGGRLMDGSGIHFSPAYTGTVEPVTLTDAWGEVSIYMLPFLKPVHVRRWFPEAEIGSYTDAVRAALEPLAVDPAKRNVLIAHQFVTGQGETVRSDSEERSVGGLDNVDAAVFDGFDYVALGHIHGPQSIDSDRIRYCGTPLKYSFSEVKHQKSVTVVELGEKGTRTVRTVPLKPLRDMVELRGEFTRLTARSFYEGTSYPEDYVHIILTDEEEVPDAVGRLKTIYPRYMKLDYDNRRTRYDAELQALAGVEQKSEFQLFAEFYELLNNAPMSEEQEQYMRELIESLKEVDA